MTNALRLLALLSSLGWAAVIYFLSAQPGMHVPLLFPWQDKVFHAIAFGIFGFLVLGCLKPSPTGYRIRQAIIAIILVALYGMLDEFHQRFVPGRTADIYDALADAVGGVLGVWALFTLVRLKPFMPGRKSRTQERL